MGDLQTNIDLLVGKQIARIHIVDAERTRQANKYLIVECDDGTRVITAYVPSLPSPAPDSLMALREAAKEHGAFTVQEALVLAEGQALGRKPKTKSTKVPDDVTTDDARGLTEAEAKVEKAIGEINDAWDLSDLDTRKDEITEMLEMIPQDRRGPWFEALGKAYKETKTEIARLKRTAK